MKATNILLMHCAVRAAVIVVAATPGAVCRSGEIPRNVESALNQNLQALSEVRLAWKLTRKTPLGLAKLLDAIHLPVPGPGGAFLKEQRAEFMYSAGNVRVRFDFFLPRLDPDAASKLQGSIKSVPASGQGNLAKSSGRPEASPLRSITLDAIQGFSPQALELSWDGNNLFYGTPSIEGMAGSLTVFPASTPFINFDTWQSDYWREIGIYVPRLSSEFASGTVIRSSVLRKQAGARAQVVGEVSADDGTACLGIRVVTSTGRVEYLLDPKLGYVVRQRIVSDNRGEILSKSTMSDFQQCGEAHRIWLPRTCGIDYYSCPTTQMPSPPSKQVLYSEEYALVNLKVGSDAAATFEPAAFVIAYASGGTRVQDGRITANGSPLQYTVPADADDLEDAIEHAKSGEPYVPGELRGSTWRLPLIVGNVVVIALLILAIWWNRHHS